MIKISVDQNDFNRIIQSMKNIEKSEESVLKTALNNTAKKAQKLLTQRAEEVYSGAAPQGILGRSEIRKATVSKVSIQLLFKSEQPGIEAHTVSLTVPVRTTYSGGKRVKFPILASQLRGAGLKPLSGEKGLAFWVKFKNGKQAIVSRRKGQRKKTSGKDVLKRIMGSSDMVMVRNEKVYGVEEENIANVLHEQIDKVLMKVMGGQ